MNGDKLEKVPSIYKDGKLTFYTSHFSTYTIVKKSNNQTGNNSKELTGLLPKTGLTTNSISTIALLLLGGVIARFRFRKNK